MPIKDLMTWTLMLMAGWYATGGYDGMMKQIRKTEIAILRDVSRPNWGDKEILRMIRATRTPTRAPVKAGAGTHQPSFVHP